MNKFHLHLVSDSTGDTVSSVAKAALAQFEHVEAIEHTYTLIRSQKLMDKVLKEIQSKPGMVLYTIIDRDLRKYLKENCKDLHMPCVSVLSNIISELSSFLNIKAESTIVGRQHELGEEYFARMSAINFAIAHDDGQSTWDLDNADIVLVGPSRTSKSPTSLYLAFKGYKTANVPYVLNSVLIDQLFKLTTPLIVGLSINLDNLIQIRKNRLLSLYEDHNMCYVDAGMVEQEIKESKKLFMKQGWPIIDVSKRSVEETAATIIQYYNAKHGLV